MIGRMWGAAPRPGRCKLHLHRRHVRWTCPTGDRDERGGTRDTGAPMRGDGKALYKAARAAVLYVLYVLYVLPRRPRLPVWGTADLLQIKGVLAHAGRTMEA